jgi:hypothetical protein
MPPQHCEYRHQHRTEAKVSKNKGDDNGGSQ